MLVLAPATCCLAAVAISDLLYTCCESIKAYTATKSKALRPSARLPHTQVSSLTAWVSV